MASNDEYVMALERLRDDAAWVDEEATAALDAAIRALSAQQPEAVATCSCGAPCRKEVLERERDGLLTMFRDALVEEILAYPEGKEVDAPDFADAVIDRLNTARGAGNGRGE